ncbi:aminoglycoside 6-adenylyltransferase [Paenibacillus thiaminolyticus]|nr:aminoglycoside 6-adenylyltransferase [Paenibacillus thiaminolyticus]
MIDSFKENDQWLIIFGNRLMMQKPEDMELFPSELGNWFSYIIHFLQENSMIAAMSSGWRQPTS